MKTIIKLIIKVLQKISKYTLTSIFTQIFNILKGKSVIRSFLMLFRWLSLLFTVLFLINDSLALHFVDNLHDLISHPSLIFDRIKNFWNKIIDFILNILGKTKLESSDDIIPDPKMLRSKNEDKILMMDINKDKIQFMNRNSLEEYINQHNKTGKDVRIIIEDASGNKFNDGWSWYWKLAFILGLVLSGGLVITMISDGIVEMISVPFKWGYNNIIHPVYAFFGIIISFILYILRGGGDPGEFSDLIRDRFGVDIFHERPDINNMPNANMHPTDNPDIQEITLNDNRTAANTTANRTTTVEPSDSQQMFGPTDKGKKVMWEDPQTQIYDPKKPTNTVMPEHRSLTVDTASTSNVTIDKTNSPVLSQLNLENSFTPANIIASSVAPEDANSLQTYLAETKKDRPSMLDQIKNKRSQLLNKLNIVESDAISKDDLDSGTAKIEGMNSDKMETLIKDDVQNKFDSLKAKSSNPMLASLSKSPMLQKAIDETDDAEDAFSNTSSDSDNEADNVADRLNKQKERMNINHPTVNTPKTFTDNPYVQNTMSTLSQLANLGTGQEQQIPESNPSHGFKPALPHQHSSPAGSAAKAAIQRATTGVARRFILSNNPFEDFWNE